MNKKERKKPKAVKSQNIQYSELYLYPKRLNVETAFSSFFSCKFILPH